MRPWALACGIVLWGAACSSGEGAGAGQGGSARQGVGGSGGQGVGGSAGQGVGGGAGGGAGPGVGGSGGRGGGRAGAGGGSAGAGGAPLGPAPGNAVVLDDGRVVPLVPVTADDLGTRAIGFTQVGTVLTAHDEHGAPIWSKDLGPGSPSGGFDFDADGVPDLALVRSTDTGVACGATTMRATSIDVVAGRTGALYPLEAPLDAICWHFGETVYPTEQWTGLGVIFGEGTSVLATQPYYAKQGAFRQFDGQGFVTLGVYEYPSTAAFDAAYPGAEPNPYGQGHAYVENAHVANGLIAPVAGEARLAFFTSARFAEIAVGPLAPDQLRVDAPFLTGGRLDLAGRDYGRVARDPGAPGTIALVSGTSADTLASDMATGTMAADPWGQIERHVALVDLASGAVDDRFFSYAHDAGDGMKYEGRVVYPEGVFVRRGQGQPSRLAFDVYEGGHWQVHVTVPGGTADAVVLKDRFLWDVRDLDGDGADEWVLSPSRDPGDPDVPGWYFCKWRTTLAHFDEATLALVDVVTVEGAIPKLVPSLRRPDATSSRGALYPALTARIDGDLALLLVGPDGALVPHVL